MGKDSSFHRDKAALEALEARFGHGGAAHVVSVPGRVNLIGEHIDYHALPVLPMAINRRLSIAFRPRHDREVRIWSSGYGDRAFNLDQELTPEPIGDWGNYARAAARAVVKEWRLDRGLEAAILSDLPPAAGLSSSSALLIGIAITLLRANEIQSGLYQLMAILPEAEHFVGTRGGGMDHAVILAAEPECALRVEFEPLSLTGLAIPNGWSFLIAHSLTTAEKSGAVREEYNLRKTAGISALQRLCSPTFSAALAKFSLGHITALASTLPDAEYRAMLHVSSEAIRVDEACKALRKSDLLDFGRLLTASHASLRDQLQVSNPALDEIVHIAIEAGAAGARVTGAGFGGCAIILCGVDTVQRVQERLLARFYSVRPGFIPNQHLFVAEPAAGVLNV